MSKFFCDFFPSQKQREGKRSAEVIDPWKRWRVLSFSSFCELVINRHLRNNSTTLHCTTVQRLTEPRNSLSLSLPLLSFSLRSSFCLVSLHSPLRSPSLRTVLLIPWLVAKLKKQTGLAEWRTSITIARIVGYRYGCMLNPISRRISTLVRGQTPRGVRVSGFHCATKITLNLRWRNCIRSRLGAARTHTWHVSRRRRRGFIISVSAFALVSCIFWSSSSKARGTRDALNFYSHDVINATTGLNRRVASRRVRSYVTQVIILQLSLV